MVCSYCFWLSKSLHGRLEMESRDRKSLRKGLHEVKLAMHSLNNINHNIKSDKDKITMEKFG